MRDTESVVASCLTVRAEAMTLLSLLIIVTIVPAFIGGWFGGYKKACDAHGWNLPSIDWNRARGTHRF
jgi:hypothetical protein